MLHGGVAARSLILLQLAKDLLTSAIIPGNMRQGALTSFTNL
jgi:hypothetical protein